jgi:hypothetical protein
VKRSSSSISANQTDNLVKTTTSSQSEFASSRGVASTTMFRAYGSFPNSGGTETSSLRNPLENIQTWGSSPIAPPPTPTPSTTSSSSPDYHSSQTQSNANSQRHNGLRHLQQSQFQNNLHAHQQQQQQQPKSPPFYIEAMNNNNNNGFNKNNDIKGKNHGTRRKISRALPSSDGGGRKCLSINFHFPSLRLGLW